MDSFWDFLWLLVVGFAFVAYLMVMFSIIGDLFRDHTTSGVIKAVWVFFLIVAPFLTALVYLIANGSNMANRQVAALQQAKDQQDEYIKQVAGRSAADEIARAKALLDNGTIDQSEFAALKVKALS